MYEIMPVYALLLKRPPDWSLERGPQIYDQTTAPVSRKASKSLKQILLACLQFIREAPRGLGQPRQIPD